MSASEGPTIVVSAGTYHLPFDRLSEWMERWAAAHPDVHLLVQHGPSRPVVGAENVTILPYADLLEHCRRADAVVLQGGAGGVMDMRALGIVPVVVPRVPGHGEVVDDHQLIFSGEMSTLGLLRRATTYDELDAALVELLAATPSAAAATGGAVISTPGAERLQRLLAEPPAALPWTRRLARCGSVARALLVRALRRNDR